MRQGGNARAIVACLAFSLLASFSDAYIGAAVPRAMLQSRRGLHSAVRHSNKGSPACAQGVAHRHCLKPATPPLLRANAICVIPLPSSDEDQAAVQPGHVEWRARELERSFARDEAEVDRASPTALAARRRLYLDDNEHDVSAAMIGQPTEDIAKAATISITATVAIAAFFNLPAIAGTLAYHTLAGGASGIAALALSGNTLLDASVSRVSQYYGHFLRPFSKVLGALAERGFMCGTYAAVYAVVAGLAPGAAGVSIAAMVTAVVTTAVTEPLERLKLVYRRARIGGKSHLAALADLWRQRSMKSLGGRGSLWSAAKLNIWGFEVFYLAWHAVEHLSPWIGATVAGNLVGGALSGAAYAASMLLGKSFAESRERWSAQLVATKLRAWFVGLRAQGHEVTLSSLAAGVRFAVYKVAYDSIARL